jgi:hypothetical protein
MDDDIDDGAMASAALLFVDPLRGLDRMGKDETIGACEFFNVYPETVGRMVSAGLLRGVVGNRWGPPSPLSWSSGDVGMRNGVQRPVSRRLYVPDAAALEVAFREEMAPTWRGCVLNHPHFFRALGHLRAATVAFACSSAGVLR